MNRQNPLKNIPKEEFEEAFKNIEESFHLEWLQNRKISNPIIDTWNRKDWLAKNELFTLGSCIGQIKKVDSKWLNAQIKK